MSDSQTRPFDAELAATDWVGFVQVVPRSGITQFDQFNPDHYEQVGNILIFTVAELSSHRPELQEAKRKSESEGSEAFLEWPVIVAPVTDEVEAIERRDNEGLIIFSKGGTIRVKKGWYPYGGLRPGKAVEAHKTILGGMAKPLSSIALECRPQNF